MERQRLRQLMTILDAREHASGVLEPFADWQPHAGAQCTPRERELGRSALGRSGKGRVRCETFLNCRR